jgi:hypothetical protein
MEPKLNPFLVAGLMNGGNQTFLHLTLATVAIIALVIFVAAFVLGLCCGRGGGNGVRGGYKPII